MRVRRTIWRATGRSIKIRRVKHRNKDRDRTTIIMRGCTCNNASWTT
jgi:hypothetical protein